MGGLCICALFINGCRSGYLTALEDRLIGAFAKPPCNAEVRAKSVKYAVRAFN